MEIKWEAATNVRPEMSVFRPMLGVKEQEEQWEGGDYRGGEMERERKSTLERAITIKVDNDVVLARRMLPHG